MGKYRRTDTALGWQNRKFRDQDHKLRELAAARRLRASSFADVPPGSIPIAALSNVTAPGYVSLTASGFGISTAGANVIDATVTVPVGFSSCVVSVVGRVFAYNSTLSTDHLYTRPDVAGATGNAVPVQSAVATAGLNVAPFTTVLVGLTAGSTFTVQLWASSLTADWASDPTNTADMSGVLLWF